MRKLNKRRLLSIVTTAAIVVTTAVSFAAWDKLSADWNGTLTLDKPVTVTAGATQAFVDEADKLGEMGTYASVATFTVAELAEGKKADMNVVATITDSSSADVTDKFTIVGLDAKPGIENGEHTFSVTVTPKTDDTGTLALAGQDLTVKLTGTLTESITP